MFISIGATCNDWYQKAVISCLSNAQSLEGCWSEHGARTEMFCLVSYKWHKWANPTLYHEYIWFAFCCCGWCIMSYNQCHIAYRVLGWTIVIPRWWWMLLLVYCRAVCYWSACGAWWHRKRSNGSIVYKYIYTCTYSSKKRSLVLKRQDKRFYPFFIILPLFLFLSFSFILFS